MKKLSSGCTLDCFDCCRFNVYVDDDKVIKIEGDKEHPYTKGFICKKGFMHLDRHNHPERQFKPLLKVNGKWREISFEEATDIMAKKLAKYKEESGTESILYYEQYGSGSLLKSIGDIFFNFYGGCSKQKGGPCWSAGIKAQNGNFGDVKSHSLEDMLNSKNIIVWGKNPAYTTIHTMQMINKAKRNGSYVIVIDPIYTATAAQADYYVQIKAGGDIALALAMGKRIIELKKYDEDYINNFVNGFEDYKLLLDEFDINELAKEAGVTLETIDFLVEKYTELYSTILLGYGLQKYKHGGNTILLIDTLAAITGQIGVSGGGVNYANKVYPGVLNLDPYNSESYANNKEFFTSHIGKHIIDNNIKMAVIVKNNLINQLPDVKGLKSAFNKIEFKVCFDQFLTDTAEVCDLFIPTTTVFEGEDLLFSSMTNPYLTYIEKAVEPKDILMDEYYFFRKVAEKLKMDNYPYVDKKEYLSEVIKPLLEYDSNVSLDYIRGNYYTIHEGVAWKDKKFLTESGKFEILFNRDVIKGRNAKGKKGLRLITTHSKDALFSPHFMDKSGVSEIYINEKEAFSRGIKDGELVLIKSSKGEIKSRLKIDNNVADGLVMMYVGWWYKHGNPNVLIESGISDFGGQVTYNEAFVEISSEI
ncbi:Anaerobic selenocysteine-containing dehydrogenase [Clostridium sp. DSM 8431]|uniref:molybdopterin-dependent oxidoreductase n=1 Tax=Clostridium sp. DSM 8431 TaxID=1761781 RepID=UPI0008E1CD0A|nr:molybdopterin-dependent oxidoreductase [Clostridium sp. DSM 8431]SFU85711.1 Anaerobic selenocysteine-containing dehydrogenase [Clostridium sp. DSM 8431]